MLFIKQFHSTEIITHAQELDPIECCGIVAGKDNAVESLYRITNTANSPYRYVMDPQEHLNADLNAERSGWEIIGFYHSHTHSPAFPSATDIRMALQSGYLDIYYILVSLENKENPHLRIFTISEIGQVTEGKLEII